jgi:hypothetical protein
LSNPLFPNADQRSFSLDVLTKRACDLGEDRDHRLGKAGIVKLLIRKMEYEKSNETGPSLLA